MEGVRLYDWLVLLAILMGPLVGVWVTRWIDAAKERRDRRWSLFETLRRTRGLELSPDHVAAINMVPVLFPDDQETMTEWGKLMSALNNPSWNSADQTVRENVQRSAADARHNLISRIGEVVGANLPKKEEHRLGYAPQGWISEMMEQAEARRRLLDVLSGRQALHMVAGVFDLGGPPEQPAVEDKEAGKQSRAEDPEKEI